MQQPQATNSSGNSRSDGGSAFAHYAADSWLLGQTIRYHQERIRAKGGVLRCELWLPNSRGIETGGGDSGIENTSSLDTVSCWRQNTSTISVPPDRRGHNNNNRHSENEYASSDNTLLGHKVANRLWSSRKDRSDSCILWRRVGSLTDSSTEEDSFSVPGQQQRKPPSFKIASKPSSDPKATIDWIASILFEVSTKDDTSLEDRSANCTTFRGMVCWLFEPKYKIENQPLNDEDAYPSHLEPFLHSATNHIAATYAVESSFEDLPLPRRQSKPQSSTSNPTEMMPNVNHSNISRKEQLPPETSIEDDSYSHNDDEVINTTISAPNGNGDDTEIALDCKTKSLATVWAYLQKFKGGGQKGPRPLCWRQTLFTFVGSFVTIYLIHCFNIIITSMRKMSLTEVSELDRTTATFDERFKAWCDDYSSDVQWEALEMGPFGATCVMVFAMTSVSPSQPRNMLFGASIGMVIGKLVGYLDLVGVGIGLRMPLATALTASIMAQTCTIYPPAAALAVIFSSQLLGWDRFALQVSGTVLTICLGVIINNLHPMREYPTFWLGIECGKAKRASESERNADGRGSSCRLAP